MIRLLFVIFPHSSRGLPLTVFYAIPVGELLQQYTPLFPKKWKDGGSVLSVISRSPDGWTVSIDGLRVFLFRIWLALYPTWISCECLRNLLTISVP